ncbi:MAG: hypothetical protein M3003_13590 [Candidatus Dormibacteraeota bacterium]|nr:hypothetical protein [Candidatus Dormibacteraeota bacterium]
MGCRYPDTGDRRDVGREEDQSAEETRAAGRLGRLECAGLAHPASGNAPVGGEEDAPADVRTLWTAPLTEAAFDGGPPFAHSPFDRPGNQRFPGSGRDTVTEQFPSIVGGLK